VLFTPLAPALVRIVCLIVSCIFAGEGDPLFEKSPIEKIYSVFFRQEYPTDLKTAGGMACSRYHCHLSPCPVPNPGQSCACSSGSPFHSGIQLFFCTFPKEGDIDLTKRIALFIGVSVAVVSMIGPGLNFVLWGIQLGPIMVSLTLFSMVLIFIARYTRAVLLAKCHFPLLRELSGKRFYRQGEAGSTGFSVQSLSLVFSLPLS
jgi:hypothetical protein